MGFCSHEESNSIFKLSILAGAGHDARRLAIVFFFFFFWRVSGIPETYAKYAPVDTRERQARKLLWVESKGVEAETAEFFLPHAACAVENFPCVDIVHFLCGAYLAETQFRFRHAKPSPFCPSIQLRKYDLQ